MTFDDLLAQVLALLQRQGRVAYGALKRRFQLDDAYLDDLKAELIEARRLAVDEAGRVLVWTGAAGAAPVPPAAAPPPPAAVAERRQLTVLFCDLIDSTVLAQQLDPEVWREVVRAYQAACAEVMQRFAGYVAQYLGDGVLVYFGYPRAHEDDAQRAVRGGLALLEAMQPLNARLERERGVRLAVRLGIHTGLVVVSDIGDRGSQERLALGATPNIAARLQGLAAPDTVVMSAATWHLLRGSVAVQDLGAQTLRGVDTPLQVYQVVGMKAAQDRFDLPGPGGLMPLVGRDAELGLLVERWAQAREGLGQGVLLSGEAGIGKSRLVQALKAHAVEGLHILYECRCSPYTQHSALYPVRELCQRVLSLDREAPPDAQITRLEVALAPSGVPLAEAVPLLAAFLSVPLGDRYAPLTLPPERHRQRTLEALVAVLLALAAHQPVLLVVEDLHWGDASTLEWLSLLLDQVPMARVLVVLTFRPEFLPPWALRAHLSPLMLGRLSRLQTERLMEHVSRGKALPVEVRRQVVEKTDGVPLFVEEFTKMLLESGLLQEQEGRYALTGPLPAVAIPTTLHDALRARLDRLGPVKDLAQLAATLGRSFPYSLLQAVSSLDDGALRQALARLVEAELLYQRGLPPQATYTFKHALIQETAYQSLLRGQRQQLHRRVALVLAEHHPDLAATQPEVLAHHYTEAGLAEQAEPLWQQAGQQAIARSAYVEALAHLGKGLEVLQQVPPSVERSRQELALYIALGQVLMATKGQGASEVAQVYARARELCQAMEATPQLFPTLAGLCGYYVMRAELQTARELGEQLLTLAQQQQDLTSLMHSHQTLGSLLFHRGELTAARAQLDQALTLYSSPPSQAATPGSDLGVVCLSYTALTLWALGYPDQALGRSHEALLLARQLAHPFSLNLALILALALCACLRDVQTTQERAEHAIALATEHGFAQFCAAATIWLGWALVQQGHGEAGMRHMQQGMADWHAVGASLVLPYNLALLAEAYGVEGQPNSGLAVLDEALTVVGKTEERWWEAEIYRLRGEFVLCQPAPEVSQAETSLRHALAVAGDQRAKSLELRAAVSLSRLWQRQGKRTEAYRLLAPVYAWFTEGFATTDLQEARALLEALA